MIDTSKFKGHTPGPWYTELTDNGVAIRCEKHKDAMNLAVFHPIGAPLTANRQLMIAAPDLLAEVEILREALRACVDAVEDVMWGYDGDCGVVNKVNVIVDDALGEENSNA